MKAHLFVRARRPRLLGAVVGAWAASYLMGGAQALSTTFPNLPGDSQAVFPPSQRFLELRVYAFADTNVRPLFQESANPQFNARRAYFQSASVYEVRLHLEPWEFSLVQGQSNYYEGNAGAARLFLEAEQGQLLPDSSYSVEATLNRSALHAWSASYYGICRTSHAPLRYWIGFSYLSLQRVQQGWLQGQKVGDSFVGKLTLLTTRGLPVSVVGGEGYTASAGVALGNGDWAAGVSVQNLWSRLSIRQAQRIEATVRVNQLFPDANGFLRAPPALEGSVNPVSLQRVAQPRAEITLWRRMGSHTLGFTAVRERDWQTALAIRWNGDRSAFQATYWHPRTMLWLTYEQPHWRVVLGADLWNSGSLRRFALELSYRLALE